MIPNIDTKNRVPFYYEKYGVGVDGIVRCADCREILVVKNMCDTIGCCHLCGCRRMKQISTLTEDEMSRIRSGDIDFPHRDEFVKEFSSVG